MSLTAILLFSLLQAKPIKPVARPVPHIDVAGLRTASSDLSVDYRRIRVLGGTERLAAMDRLLIRANDLKRRSENLKSALSGKWEAKDAEALHRQIATSSESTMDALQALRPDLPKERQKSPIFSGAFRQKKLKDEIKALDEVLAEVKDKRQEYTTEFENFDQKANQLFNLLATVLKNEKEAQMGITRNML